MDKWLETRQLQVHHVSAAGYVFKDDKLLLVKDSKKGWEIPGGVMEQGESILECLKREIYEESGIIAEPLRLIEICQRRTTKPGFGPLEGITLPPTFNLLFICSYKGGSERTSDESLEVGWYSLEEASEMISDSYMKKVFADMLKDEGKMRFASFRQDGEVKDFDDDIVL